VRATHAGGDRDACCRSFPQLCGQQQQEQ
jgi:hypothetical protein